MTGVQTCALPIYLKETVAIAKALWRGERLAPEMSTLADLRHFKLEMKPLRPSIPIFIASLQDKAIREIGKIADGWVPTFWPYKHFAEGLALVAEGARQTGRDPEEIELAPFMAVVPMDDVDMARSMIKPLVAFYIGGMGVYYHALFCRYGFEENANLVRELYNSGERRKAGAAVADDLIDAIAICGPADHCREKLVEWRTAGVGTALMNLPAGAPFAMAEQLLRTMAP